MKERKESEVNKTYLKQIAYQKGVSFYCKKICPKCFGRGYIAVRLDGKRIPCKCVVGIMHQPMIKNLEQTLKEGAKNAGN